MLSLGLKITMGVIMAIQLLAIGYATHLVRRTKYSVIWILCIVCFVTSFAQHLIYILSNGIVDFRLFITFDLILSAALAVAVFFANKLVNYINRLNYQRNLLSKRLLSTVLRTEERSRSQFAKVLHDGIFGIWLGICEGSRKPEVISAVRVGTLEELLTPISPCLSR